MTRIFMILLVLVLVGCTESLNVQLDPEEVVFFSDDSEKRVPISQKDQAYKELNKWLSEHNSGWYTTAGQYPGGVYLKSSDYGIQVTENHVVLYSTEYKDSRAIYIQNIDKGELSGIRNLGQ
ncbi:MAG: hypothetical protein KUG73_02870 [Pseudomonadales bacterium]|nr:hypothetical protein [Pseudomonadales bacterium]